MKLLVTGGSGFIGANVLAHFHRLGTEQLNFDWRPPLAPEPAVTHRTGDILDAAAVAAACRDFQPDWVLHLAGRAETDENTTVEAGYQANTTGTANVLAAVRATPSVQRLVVTSSQYVCRPGYQPRDDTDTEPETVYGHSKVITEQLTRDAGLGCAWTLIRPVNIWGPWHLRYRRQVWRTLQKGFYLHPGHEPVVRTYGYVGNVASQIERIFTLPVEEVNGLTLNVGDPPINIFEWVEGFSRALRGRGVTVVPRPVMRTLGAVGDGITRLRGREFLLTSSRYRSMVTEYVTPLDKTLAILGPSPYTLPQGIEQSVAWLRSYRPGDGLVF